MSEQRIPDDVVDRMVALVRRMSKDSCEHADGPTRFCYRDYSEARNITAQLPEPPDPDLIEARQVAGDALVGFRAGDQMFSTGHINAIRAGAGDDDLVVQAALAGIKRGRELAKQESGQ